MPAPSLNPARPSVELDYREWQLTARWFPEWAGTAAGWICFVRAPGAGGRGDSTFTRRETAEDALAVGRSWVDRKIDGAAAASKRAPARHQGRGKT